MYSLSFAEYYSATPKMQKQLLSQEMVNPVHLVGAPTAHKVMRNYFLQNESRSIIDQGIADLKSQSKQKKRAEAIRKKSLLMLEDFRDMNPPRLLNCEVKKYPKIKEPFAIHDLSIDVSPHLVFLVKRADGIHLGAFLFRTCISGQFGQLNCEIAAFLLEKYLRQVYANTIFKVDKDLCFCIDPHNNCWASSPHDEALYNAIIEETYAMITSQHKSAA